MLLNAIAIANGKGGVGKTTLTANLGGIAARDGARVLLVDLDPQGNLASDLGYHDDPGNDRGRSLAIAAQVGEGVEVRAGVRERLDVVTGGEGTDQLEENLRRRAYGGDPTVPFALERALLPVAANYDLILIDCPPAMGTLVEAAFTVARFVLIPTRGDAASLNGLSRTATRFVSARRSTNAELDLLGVVLFGFGTQDTKLLAKARAQLTEALVGIAPVYETFIRTARKAPDDMRELGLLAYEYRDAARNAPKWYADRAAPRYSASADGLADDYEALATEVLERFVTERGRAFQAA